MANTVIRTERLSKNYGRRLGIADVDMEVFAGEVFGYLGPNGARKTTTIRVFMDFLRADKGTAEIFGLDVRRAAWTSAAASDICRAKCICTKT